MTPTTRKQASLRIEERKLILLIEEEMLQASSRLKTPGVSFSIQFVTGKYSEELILSVMRKYIKGGWRVSRSKHSTVDRQPGQMIMVVNLTTIDFV